MRYLIAIITSLVVSVNAYPQLYKDSNAPIESRVNDLLSKMTLEEKINYLGGINGFYIRPVQRLGLPEIKMSDGPVGTRNDGNTTAYPASILSAATWDTSLISKLGVALGKDAKARGINILLAPGVNIYRAPMGGRNFEYFGEDPFLAGRMAVSYIKGVQSQGVVATVKHYAGNNQEWDRNNVSSDIDERTLQEIYLPAFKAAVTEGKVGAVMNSYNLVNGVHSTQNNHLNNDILKGAWKFDGIVMSDWVATYDGVAAAKGGLDLEMPSAAFMNLKNLLPAINDGSLQESIIDDKVRRILRIIFRFGFYDHNQLDSSIPKDNPESAAVALDLAKGGVVLLKNSGNILPLSDKIKSIAVIGPNADQYTAGGGSSYTRPFHSITLLQGIKEIAANRKVTYTNGSIGAMEEHINESDFYVAPGSLERGLKAQYFNNQNLEGEPVITLTDKSINHTWTAEPGVPGIGADHFSIRFTGILRPSKSGDYKLSIRGDDGFRLFVNNKNVIDLWSDHGAVLKSTTMPLEAGKEYSLKLEYYENAGTAQIAFASYMERIDFTEAVKAASAADIAVVSVGFNSTNEGEGSDRTFELPVYQDTLIHAISKANPNTIVILNAGGNVYMANWLSSVKGLLHAWYSGQEGGTAIAEILFGKVNPSGKLPASFEENWNDNPTFNNYYDKDNIKRVAYREGLNLGYRYYDKSKVKPLFPFGFGMSYTTFQYYDLKVSGYTRDNVLVSFKIKNTGAYDGAEVAQVYVHQEKNVVERPVKELKGFAKVFLKKGETKLITVPLNADAFSYYKVDKKAFGYDAGKFDILVGSSSADIKLNGIVEIK